MKTETLYTIGHSTLEADVFLEMLQSFHIQTLVDIRSLPGSRKFPQFNQEVLSVYLEKNGIHYIHLKALGGRRGVSKNSHNTRWRKDAFRGYADYMETAEFETGIADLEEIAQQSTTAIMCSEAVWWRCHRSMVSDFMKAKGWNIQHIMTSKKSQEHPYTQPARIVGNHVVYTEEEKSASSLKG